MEESLILETTFLIDLERELGKESEGPAQRFLLRHTSSRLYVTFTVAGEMAAGKSLAERETWLEFLQPFHVLPCTLGVCWEYGRLFRYLSRNGRLIGSNDLWIAATALANAIPVVTRNEKHFKRVPDLKVYSYSR